MNCEKKEKCKKKKILQTSQHEKQHSNEPHWVLLSPDIVPKRVWEKPLFQNNQQRQEKNPKKKSLYPTNKMTEKMLA